MVIAALSLGGCLCSGERTGKTAYVAMTSYGPAIAECIGNHDCDALCSSVFQLDGNAEIERCAITSFVGQDGTSQVGSIAAPVDPSSLRGANVQVTYTEQGSCSYESDDGSTNDGSTDDGSTDNGSTDDGSTDDGSTDDGSGDGSDDGSTDDGGAPTRAPSRGLVRGGIRS